MPRLVLDQYTWCVGGVCVVGLIASVALSLMQASQWIEAHPTRARSLGIGYGCCQLCLIWVFYLGGDVPPYGALWCCLSTLCSLLCMLPKGWPHARSRGMMCYGAAVVFPLAAHASITTYHNELLHAWLEQEHVPLRAEARHVMALVLGLVWALPVFQFVSETTQEWSLPGHQGSI